MHPISELRKDILLMHTLQEEFPLLFELFKSIDSLPYAALNSLYTILKKLLEKAYQPFQGCSSVDTQLQADDDTVASISYFPCLPIIRARGTYKIDLNRKQAVCNKQSTGHPTLLPGIFTIFCNHGNDN